MAAYSIQEKKITLPADFHVIVDVLRVEWIFHPTCLFKPTRLLER